MEAHTQYFGRMVLGAHSKLEFDGVGISLGCHLHGDMQDEKKLSGEVSRLCLIIGMFVKPVSLLWMRKLNPHTRNGKDDQRPRLFSPRPLCKAKDRFCHYPVQ
jgi:hypothetical protein